MKETEITVQVFDTLDNVIKILKDKGFKETEQFRLNDYYFSKYTTNELKKMKYIDIIDNSLIVREIIDDTPNRKIIYKKKNLDDKGNVLSEEKFSTKIDSTYTARNILSMAGLTEWCKSENTSYIYKLGELCVAIQNVTNLGLFIEVEEYPSMSKLTLEEKFAKLVEDAKGLGLKLGDDFSVKKPYLILMKED